MIEKEIFDELKEKYSDVSSWMIWDKAGDTKKSNVGNLDFFKNEKIYSKLNNDYVFIGLNASNKYGDAIPFSNFHSSSSKHNDYKLRFAFQNTKFWGNYITDIFKNYNEVKSEKLCNYVKHNHEFENQNHIELKKELDILGGSPILIALGNSAYRYLKRFAKKFNYDSSRIIKIMHYSAYVSMEAYRIKVLNALENLD